MHNNTYVPSRHSRLRWSCPRQHKQYYQRSLLCQAHSCPLVERKMGRRRRRRRRRRRGVMTVLFWVFSRIQTPPSMVAGGESLTRRDILLRIRYQINAHSQVCSLAFESCNERGYQETGWICHEIASSYIVYVICTSATPCR